MEKSLKLKPRVASKSKHNESTIKSKKKESKKHKRSASEKSSGKATKHKKVQLDSKQVKEPDTIDDIFGEIKEAKKREQEELEEIAARVKAEKAKQSKEAAKMAQLERAGKVANSGGTGDDPTPLRFDPTLGMNIYSEESLKMGKGGNTPLCPFDCDCCF